MVYGGLLRKWRAFSRKQRGKVDGNVPMQFCCPKIIVPKSRESALHVAEISLWRVAAQAGASIDRPPAMIDNLA